MSNRIRRACALSLLVVAASSLGACATAPGPLNGYSRDSMATIAVVRNPDEGQLTDTQYQLTAEHAAWCAEQADRQLSGPGESAAVMGVGGAISGALGVGGGARAGGLGGPAQMGPYGAIAGGTQGIWGGLVMNSSERATFIGRCVSGNFEDAATRTRDPEELRGVHVYDVRVRSRNRTGRLPAGVVVTGQPPAPSPARNPARSGGASGSN